MKHLIDLHIHSSASDGTDTPTVLLGHIRSAGLRAFSVTDHDTIAGTLEMEHLVPPELHFVRGIEFSCITPAGKCHILGYGFDPDDPVFQEAIAEGRRMRRQKMEYRIGYLAEHSGIVLTDAELTWLWAQSAPGKPHLATILKDRGIVDRKEDAFPRYLKATDGGNDRIDAALAIRGILHAGGIPVWAHPLGGEGESPLEPEKFRALLETLTACGIRGMECHYSRYDPRDIAFLTGCAEAHGLLISGGSDYHGSNKQNIHLGKLRADSQPVQPEQLTLLSHLFPDL